MNRDNRLGIGCDCRIELIGSYVVVVADVDQNRLRAGVNDSRYRSHERVAHRNHLASRSDSCREQGEIQGVVATIDADSMLYADKFSQILFKVTQLLTQDQITLGECIRNRKINFVL